MQISIISAVSDNGVIGNANKIPWKQRRDMEYFKEKTSYSDKLTIPALIMGRKTFDSLPKKFKPLPGRHSIVITRNKDIVKIPGVIYVNSLAEAISEARKLTSHAFIIGGAEIYKQALEADIVDTMFITRVVATVEGDTFFPPIDESKFKNTVYHGYGSDADNEYPMEFQTWVRI